MLWLLFGVQKLTQSHLCPVGQDGVYFGGGLLVPICSTGATAEGYSPGCGLNWLFTLRRHQAKMAMSPIQVPL